MFYLIFDICSQLHCISHVPPYLLAVHVGRMLKLPFFLHKHKVLGDIGYTCTLASILGGQQIGCFAGVHPCLLVFSFLSNQIWLLIEHLLDTASSSFNWLFFCLWPGMSVQRCFCLDDLMEAQIKKKLEEETC